MPQHASAAQHVAARLPATPLVLAANAAELDMNNAAPIMIFFFTRILLSRIEPSSIRQGRRNGHKK
jgi:hypothetical protein